MCGRAGRLTGAPLGCKQQAARWGEATWARCWRSSKQQCRQEKQAARWGRHGKQDRIRSKLKQDGEAANGARWEKQ